MMKNFVHALQFLTIFTVHREETGENSLARSMVYFPAVGFLIGFILVNADRLMMVAALPQSIINALLVAFSVLITRALHVDGLADTFDGLMGGRDQSSRLAIMKDSRLGTAGALGIFFVLFLKYVSLNNLFEGEKAAALLTAPLLSRWSQTLMVFNAVYGREQGMGKAFVGHLRASGLVASSLIAVALSAFVIVRLDTHSSILIACLLGGVLVLTGVSRWYLIRAFGGVTGDSIGAVSELNEALVLLICVIFANGN